MAQFETLPTQRLEEIGRKGKRDIYSKDLRDWNFGNISFDNAKGGTLVLGGANDVNGTFALKDSANLDVITMDNTGSHYFDTTGKKLLDIDYTGLKSYDIFGDKLTSIDNVGFHSFDTTGHELIKVDNTGLHAYDTSGIERSAFLAGGLTLFDASGNPTMVQIPTGTVYYNNNAAWFMNTSNQLKGFMRMDTSNHFQMGTINGLIEIMSPDNMVKLIAYNSVVLEGHSDGSVYVNDPIYVGGSPKSAIVETSKGYKGLYCAEAPDVWFFDFCEAIRIRKFPLFWKTELKILLDPLFIEVSSPPYIVMKTETPNIVQVWAKRKGMEKTRFGDFTEAQFKKNNSFWEQAHKV